MAQHTDHEFRTAHYEGVADRLSAWLAAIWHQQAETLAVLREACTVLALASCSQTTLKDGVLSTVYPYPERPEDAKLVEPWEQACLKVASHRQATSTLFESSPTRTAATTGTLWGAYQAIVEYEDYGRPRATAMSKLFGAGKARKETAFSVCMALV